ncbi:transferase [Vibrio alginolyticus]|nr:transferase [Vibrio alginolyticus]
MNVSLSNKLFNFVKKIKPKAIITYRSLVFFSLAKLKYFSNVNFEKKIKIIQRVSIQGEGFITFKEGCVMGVFPSPNFYKGEIYLEARSSTSKINIGRRVFINNNAAIISDKSSITIGDDTLIGPNFICFDSNFHPLNPEKRLSDDYSCNPVTIGNNVFIGANVTVLQGVTIGDNSVIGAGLVVCSDIPSNVIVKASSTHECKLIKSI